jgi:hypothetical protein
MTALLAAQIVGCNVNNELERMLNETIVEYFKAPSRNFPGKTADYCENPVRISDLWNTI